MTRRFGSSDFEVRSTALSWTDWAQRILNFALQLERRASLASASGSKPESSDAFSSSVFTDIQKLGLKLEGDKAAVDYLVIEHVEKPTQD